MACRFSSGIGCRHSPCPLNNQRVKDLLDIYFDGVLSAERMNERIAKSSGDPELRFVFQAQVYKLFPSDEGYEAVRHYWQTGEMTIVACDELHRVKENYIEMTNKEFAAKNEEFRAACKRVGIDPTSRQAARWKNRKGLAWKEGRNKAEQMIR